MKLADTLIDMPLSKAFLVGVVIAGLYWFVGYDSGTNWETAITGHSENISKLRAEQKQLQEDIQRAKNFKENIQLKDEQFQTFTNYIPAKLSVADMMKAISSEAKAAGTNIIGIEDRSRSQRTQSEFYETISINVELEGTFPQHLLFLSFLTRLETIITIENIDLKSAQSAAGADGSAVKLSAVLVGYRYTGGEEEEVKPGRKK